MRYLFILFLFNLCSKQDIRNIDEEVAHLATSAGWQPRDHILKRRWSLVTASPSFNSRDGAALVFYNNTYYLLGGWNPSFNPATNNEVWTSPDLIIWTQQADAPWNDRHSFGCFVWQNKIWVLGGDYNTDIWTYDNGSWTEVNSNADCFQNKRVAICGVHDNKMWVIGGWKEEINNGVVTITQYDDVWSSVDGITWTLVNSTPGFTPRGAVYGLPSFAGKMWVIGGTMMTGIDNVNDPNPANRYPQYAHYTDIWNSTDGVTWNNITSGNWTGKDYSNVFVYDNALMVTCGHNASENNTKKVYYSYNGANWREITAIPFSGKHAASICINGSTLYLACGSENSGVSKNIWKLN